MSRVLGVHCKSHEILFAVSEGGKILEEMPERVEAPALYEQNEALLAAIEDVGRVIDAVNPDEVRILLPEQTYKDSYRRIAPRAALETVVRAASAQKKISLELLHRVSARARLGVSNKGKFETVTAEVVAPPVGRYWKGGRALAAAAAKARAA